MPRNARPLPPKEPPRADDAPRRKKSPKSVDKSPVNFLKEFRDIKPTKKVEERSLRLPGQQGLRDDNEEAMGRKRKRLSQNRPSEEEIIRPKILKVRIPITVKDLASEMKLKASQLIAKLFMQGVVLTLNDFLEDETTIQLLGQDFDCDISIDTAEEESHPHYRSNHQARDPRNISR